MLLSYSNSKDNIFTTPLKGTNYGIHPTCTSSTSEQINKRQNLYLKKNPSWKQKFDWESDWDRKTDSLFNWGTSTPLVMR